jgi:asparaginyl-tRNA synthetase
MPGAENSNTSLHLAEFWMVEPEIAFADLSDNAALAEALLSNTPSGLLNEKQEDLAFFDRRIEKGLVAKLEGIVGSEFVHMDYGEAIEVLEQANQKFEFPVKWGVDLQSEHERYPTEKLAPGIGEIIGGGQREERLDVLDARMAERGIDRDHYAWYRDLRRYGAVPLPPPSPARGGGRDGGLRAHAGLRHRPRQRPRRDPLPAHPRQRAVLR